MVAEPLNKNYSEGDSCSLAKISMVAEQWAGDRINHSGCSLAKISMVAEQHILLMKF